MDDDDDFLLVNIHNDQIRALTKQGTQSEVITLEEHKIDLRPRDQSVWDRDQYLYETKTNYCETETETKKVVSRPCWSRDLNIPGKVPC